MIKQTHPDFKVIKEEFEKGNIYNLAKIRTTDKENTFAIIKEIKEDYMLVFDIYSCSAKTYGNSVGRNECETEDWNWAESNFYILTPEEARPYLQKIMLATLENSEDKK